MPGYTIDGSIPTDLNADLCRLLAEDRATSGLGASAYAKYLTERTGHTYHPTTIVRIESGHRKFGLDEAVRVLAHLGLALTIQAAPHVQ